MPILTMLEFSTDEDYANAKKLCARLGFGDSWAYCTSSDIPGLYCLPLCPTQAGKVIVKTAEFGMVVIQTFEE